MADVTRRAENKKQNNDEIQDLATKVSNDDAANVKGGLPPGPPCQKPTLAL